ncbi:MAG TPA: PorV/PorQ family protein [Candidatus Cloacimonadota bacterium]|nr:PorV/PorQ family protein [Candidatus Cloacimonadota bacterium]
MKKLFVILVIVMLTAVLLADTSGEAGFQMLKINTGATVGAQSGTGAFTTEDAFGFMHNPTAGIWQHKRVISLAQNYWIMDCQLNSGAYYYSQGSKAFGIGYRYLDYGKQDNRNDAGEITGEFHPMDMVITTNAAYRLNPDMYLGANLHILYEKIDAASALGVAFDLGYTYLTPFQDFKLAVALKNLGKTDDMDKEDIELPITAEFNLIKDFQLGMVPLSTELKLLKHSDDDDLKMALGLNAQIVKMLELRFGYKFNYDSEDLSAGFGIKLKKIDVDYAYVPHSSELGDAHLIGLTYKF